MLWLLSFFVGGLLAWSIFAFNRLVRLRNQVKAIIVQESWKMSFASSDAEFESLLAGMQETAKGLGYDQVLEVDMANAKEQDALRQESAAGA